jgi:hypothetical protein
MRPATLHYVLTVEDSIMLGRHFYSSSTSQQSAFGMIHTFIINSVITNVRHDNVNTMIRRMMTMWHVAYDEDPFFNPSSGPHVPDMTTMAGLMDVIAIGNLLELAHVIDHRHYDGEIQWVESREMAMARWRYRKLQTHFAKWYVTIIDGVSVCPISVFRRSLVEFAAAIIIYKRKATAASFPKAEGCSKQLFERKMYNLFQVNYPELMPRLRTLVTTESEHMYWNGPPITIRRREKGDRMRSTKHSSPKKMMPTFDFPDSRLYPEHPSTVGDDCNVVVGDDSPLMFVPPPAVPHPPLVETDLPLPHGLSEADNPPSG